MLWSEQKDTFVGALIYRVAPIFLVILTLVGCGFRPMYGQNQTAKERGVLQSLKIVEVGPIADRTGQLLRNELLDRLPKSDAERQYLLRVRVSESTTTLIEELDTRITRVNLTLTAVSELIQKSDGTVLWRKHITGVASYNFLRDPYSTLSAKENARQRAAEDIANSLVNHLSVFFDQRAAGYKTVVEPSP